MNTSLPKYTAGSKIVTIREPGWFLSNMTKLYIPHITALKVTKSHILMYTIQLQDTSNGRILDIAFEIPQHITNSVKLAHSGVEEETLAPIWETNDPISNQFREDLNTLLHHWLSKVQTACSLQESPPSIYFPSARFELKWPWKNLQSDDYFSNFKPDSQLHVFKIGVAYYQPEKNYIGVTLQLSAYPGRTLSAINKQNAAAKEERRANKRPRQSEESKSTDSKQVDSTDNDDEKDDSSDDLEPLEAPENVE